MQKQEDKNAAHKGNTPEKAENPSKPVAQDKSGARTMPSDKKADREDGSDASRAKADSKEQTQGKRIK